MSSEMMGGKPERKEHRSPVHAYYFGGIMMSTLHLAPIQETMSDMFGKQNITILASALSKDLPPPRKKQIAADIEKRLREGEKVTIICHSLGTVEAMRVLKTIHPEQIEAHHEQLSVDLISPAGLFSNPKGMAEFLRRFVDNSVLREKFKPSFRRGIESLAIYPPTEIPEFAEVMRLLFPDWAPAKVQGIPERMNGLLKLDKETVDALRYEDQFVRDAIELHNRGLLEQAIIRRGQLLLPAVMRFHKETNPASNEATHNKRRIHFGHFTEAGKIVTRLLTGQTNEMLHILKGKGVAVRFVYLSKDPIVLRQDIMDFYNTEDWEELVRLQLAIPVGDLGHSSHVVLPDVLRLLKPSLP